MTGISLRLPLLLFLLLAVPQVHAQGAPPAGAGPRLALLIDNPVRPDGEMGDGEPSPSLQAIADRLTRLGFAVTKIENADKARMSEAIRTFTGKVREGSAALFLFRGAMLRLGQRNLLMPADAHGSSIADAREAGIEFNTIEGDLSAGGAGIKIIIVDAARSDVVADRFGITPSGPAALDLHDGTLAILNAGHGKAAATDQEDVFLAELLKQTSVPNVTVEQAFSKTRVAVAKATAGRQVPSVSSSLLNDFYFGPDAPAAAAPASPPPAAAPAAAPPAPPAAKPPPPPKVASSAPSQPAAAPMPGETFKDCDTCPELVVVPAGEFMMGSNDNTFEKPLHKVVIAKPFAIGRHEVTFAQWDACAAAEVCKGDIDDHGFGRGQNPVIDVSWDEAQAFLKWLSAQSKQAYRLPSEAEWEYAARAGSRSAYPWGAAVGSGKANCVDCSPTPARGTMPVGSFRPNAFGLYDTVGNAAEWVADCWNAGYKGAPSDGTSWGTGQCQLRVIRGGAFGTKANTASSPARFRYDSDVRYYTNGFRVARDVQ